MTKALLKEYIETVIGYILSESKQNIINLGFPPTIASIFIESFGKSAFLLAKWYKEYINIRKLDNQTWWKQAYHGSFRREEITLDDLVSLYEAAISGNPETFLQAREKAGLALDPEFSWRSRQERTREEILASLDLEEKAKEIKEAIKENLFQGVFFSSVLVKDIIHGKITDLKPFSNLSFDQAQDKYDKKRVFKEATPLKVYPNGWKWINVGPKCQLVGGQMKNCGSTGVMSFDEDRTMVVLFDKSNKPHVVGTWSPNEKRLSGVEGVASTAPKEKYEDYVLDLTKVLGVKLDWAKSKSVNLALKALLGAENISSIQTIGHTFPNYKLTLKNGEVWYTNQYSFIPEKDVLEALPKYNDNLTNAVSYIFGRDKAEYQDKMLVLMDMAKKLGVDYYSF